MPDVDFRKPAPDQIELNVFGPGYGECCVVHLGDDRWMIVDSCIDTVSGEPAALQYLTKIGVELATAVKLIVVSHWHDDHVRGLSKVVDACKSASVCVSDALAGEEFFTLAKVYAKRPMMIGPSGLSEMYAVTSQLQHRKGASRPKRVSNDKRIYNLSAAETAHGLGCEVWTLSPSDKQKDISLRDIAKLMPSALNSKKRMPLRNPNDLSVVTWVKFGDIALLLGGDLEVKADAECGWVPIIQSTNRPTGKAKIFKIPHHGSANAHADDVWRDMVVDTESLAVLTPYSRGREKLPSEADAARLIKKTSSSYITSDLKPLALRRRPPEVQKEARNKITSALFSAGAIQFRNGGRKNPDVWTVATWNGAGLLEATMRNRGAQIASQATR